MKRVIAAALLSSLLTAVGCGGSVHPSSPEGSSSNQDAELATTTRLPLRSLQNDRDDDDESGEEIGVNPKDSDIDGDNDRARLWGFYDQDDLTVTDWGSEARGAERRKLVLFARRYYGLAVARQGTSACAMLTRTVARSVPQDYGHGSAGPAYLSSGSTCGQVLTLLFAHVHAQLSAPIEILRVRVRGDEALVLVGSAEAPASDFELVREHGAWRNLAMLAYPLT